MADHSARFASRPVVTAKRLAWLRRLDDEGPAERLPTPVGWRCHQLGWTEWDWRDAEGTPLRDEDEAKARYGERWWEHISVGQRVRLSDAGRVVLMAAGVAHD